MQEAEKPFPYVKFRTMKRFVTTESGINGDLKPEDYYLRVDGVHNSIENLSQQEKRGHMIVGFGNLDNPKFNEIRNVCEMRMGIGINQALYKSVMDERVQKAKDERTRQTQK